MSDLERKSAEKLENLRDDLVSQIKKDKEIRYIGFLFDPIEDVNVCFGDVSGHTLECFANLMLNVRSILKDELFTDLFQDVMSMDMTDNSVN